MGLKRETSKRAEGVGYYQTSYASDAADVLDVLSTSLSELMDEEPFSGYGVTFKVTVIVEEV